MELEAIKLATWLTDSFPIEFLAGGGFQQFDHTLRLALPDLFRFLDSLTPDLTTDTDANNVTNPPAYVLCSASGHTLNPIPQAFPTADNLIFASGGPKVGWKSRTVFIGAPAHIINFDHC